MSSLPLKISTGGPGGPSDLARPNPLLRSSLAFLKTGRSLKMSKYLETSILLDNAWVKKEVKRETWKQFELTEIENTTYHNVWNYQLWVFPRCPLSSWRNSLLFPVCWEFGVFFLLWVFCLFVLLWAAPAACGSSWTEPTPQQWPKLLRWQHWMLSLLHHKGPPKSRFFYNHELDVGFCQNAFSALIDTSG